MQQLADSALDLRVDDHCRRRRPDRRLEGFHEQEKVGRPAARERGDGIHLRFMFDPDGGADGGHDGFRQGAVGGADARGRVQSGGPKAVQGRPIRHGAHDRDVRAELLEEGPTD